MNIIVDTREQLPLWEPGKKVTRRKLIVGDYTTALLEYTFAIERKSGIDLYGSILKGHIRFRKEFFRAKDNNIKLVIYVECSKKDFELKKFPSGAGRKCPGETLIKIVDTMTKRHGIEVVWCKDRAQLINKLLTRLRKEETTLLKNVKVGKSLIQG